MMQTREIGNIRDLPAMKTVQSIDASSRVIARGYVFNDSSSAAIERSSDESGETTLALATLFMLKREIRVLQGNKMLRSTLLLIGLLAFTQFAAAVSPRPGVWWSPTESGRGYSIELQDNVMVVATFAYDHTGAPMWYLSSGIYNYSTGTFIGDFGQEKSGQCFGCPYVKPVPVTGPFPPIKFVFDTSNSGTVYYNGGTSRIQPEYFAYQPNTPTILKGEWTWSFQVIPGVYDTEWPVLNSDFVASSGQAFVSGSIDGLAGSVCVADYDAPSGAYAFLCQASNYNHFFFGFGDDRRILGQAWLTPNGTNISGNGSPAVGAKVLSLTEINNITPVTAPDPQAIARHQSEIFSHVSTDGEPPELAARMHARLASVIAGLAIQ